MPKSENYNHLFSKEMDTFGRRFDLPRIFDDFLTVSICSVHQTNIATQLKERDEENEKLYLETIKPYKKDELNQSAKLFSYVQISVYENPYDNLLGQYFTDHIIRGWNGQFFTPESVCELMARMQGADDQTKGKCVYNPACGSGRLLLQFAKAAPANYFYTNDVSITCAKMTALNFMLNGLKGEVACMNTLSMEWGKGWHINSPNLGIMPIDKNDSIIWAAPKSNSNNGK